MIKTLAKLDDQGRVYLPVPFRNAYGVSGNSFLEICYRKHSELVEHQFYSGIAEVDSAFRVLIPWTFRKYYGLGKGDFLDFICRIPLETAIDKALENLVVLD